MVKTIIEENMCATDNVKNNKTDDVQPEIVLSVPPDGGWGWVVVAGSFICLAFVDGLVFTSGILIKAVQQDFQASDQQVAPISALMIGFYLLAGPFVSALMNKYGFRLVTIIGSLTSSVAFAVSYFAVSVEFLYVTYGILGGTGCCLMHMPAVVVVGFYFESKRALASGLALCGSGAGLFVLSLITNMLIEKYNWRIAVLTHGALMLLGLVCGALFRPILSVQVTPDESEDKPLQKIIENIDDEIALDTKISRPLNNTRSYSVDIANSPFTRRYSVSKSIIKKENRRDSIIEVAELLMGCPLKVSPQDRRRSQDVGVNCLNFQDMFYSGSMKKLPQFTSRSSLGYQLAIARDVQEKVALEDKKNSKWLVCVTTARKKLTSAFNFNLFRSPTFLCFAISGFFTILGFIPFILVKQRAEDHGITPLHSVLLVSTLGITNIFGRAACGLVSSMSNISPLLMNNVALSIGGIATMMSGICYHEVFQFAYCALYGLSVACFASLRSTLIVQYIGLEKLTDCYGLLHLFQGIGALISTPIAGILTDLTHSYDAAFYVSGGCLLLSAIILYPLKLIDEWETKSLKHTESNA